MLDLFTCVCFTTSSMIHSLLFRYCTTETEASLSVFLTRAKWVGRVSIYPHYTLCSARCLEWLISRFPFLLYFSISLILSSFFLFSHFPLHFIPFLSLPPFFPFYPPYFLFSFSTLIFPCLPIFPFLSIPFVFSSFHFLRILFSYFFLFLSCSPPPIILIILLFFPIFHPFKLSYFQLYLSCRASLSFTNKSSTVLVERC